MARPRPAPRRGDVGRVKDVRFVEVEFAAPSGTRMIVELGDGVRLLVSDRDAIELAGDLIEYLRRPRRKGGRQ